MSCIRLAYLPKQSYKNRKIVLFFGIFVVNLQRPTEFSMRVIAKKKLVEYYTLHPQAKTALDDWCEKTEKAEWHSFADIKKTFNSVDYVGNQHYVFNIKGNDFRLVVVIKFTPQNVFIRFIGTHAEYDKIENIENL